jgi:steroid Delta-isomerase
VSTAASAPVPAAPIDAVIDLPFPDDADRSARAASLRSRACVEAGDREGWLALFAEDAVVADPVGPSPLDPAGLGHRGRDAIGAFFDTYIAPNEVRLALHRSSQSGAGDEVANVLTISMALPDGSSTSVPVVAIYKVDGGGRIESLRAFWELDQLTFTPAPS